MFKLMYDRKAVGERVQTRRVSMHLTQDKLAELIDKTTVTIADIERGAAGMSMKTLFDLCNVLKTTPNDLLLPERSGDMSELEWLNEALANSSEHVRATAIDIARAYLKSVE